MFAAASFTMESQLRGLKVNEVVSAENSLKVPTRDCGRYIYEEADEKHVNVGFLGSSQPQSKTLA